MWYLCYENHYERICCLLLTHAVNEILQCSQQVALHLTPDSGDAKHHWHCNTSIPLTKRQFVVTHTIHQTEIPTLLDSCVANTPNVKMLCPQKNCLLLYFHINITCLSVSALWIGQVHSVSCTNVYQWVTKYCCFMSNKFFWRYPWLMHVLFKHMKWLYLQYVPWRGRRPGGGWMDCPVDEAGSRKPMGDAATEWSPLFAVLWDCEAAISPLGWVAGKENCCYHLQPAVFQGAGTGYEPLPGEPDASSLGVVALPAVLPVSAPVPSPGSSLVQRSAPAHNKAQTQWSQDTAVHCDGEVRQWESSAAWPLLPLLQQTSMPSCSMVVVSTLFRKCISKCVLSVKMKLQHGHLLYI